MAEMRDNAKQTGKSRDGGGIGEMIRVIIHALILALIVRTFLFQPFNIPSGSMKSTLLVGDYLFVSKYSYGYSRYSFPLGLLPFSGRIWPGKPERGDVVVFRLPRETSTDYIKRVIGLPGDRIQMINGVLHINSTAVQRRRVADFVEETGFGHKRRVARFMERLDNGVEHMTLDLNQSGFADNTREYLVPTGHYFMMGDNRDNSTDSRFLNEVGFVPAENLVGRARMIFFSMGSDARFWEFWRWPGAIRWDRFFTSVK